MKNSMFTPIWMADQPAEDQVRSPFADMSLTAGSVEHFEGGCDYDHDCDGCDYDCDSCDN